MTRKGANTGPQLRLQLEDSKAPGQLRCRLLAVLIFTDLPFGLEQEFASLLCADSFPDLAFLHGANDRIFNGTANELGALNALLAAELKHLAIRI
jgi:hypothetical protein